MLKQISQLIDRFGRAISGTPERDTAGRWPISASVADRQLIASVIGDVTPAKIRAAFDEATSGWIGSQIELADTVTERDPHIRSLYATRRTSVLALDRIVVAGDESDQAKTARDEFAAVWDRFPTNRLIEILLRAHSHQWAVAQIKWDVSGKWWTPVSPREVDCRALEWPQVDPAAEAGSTGDAAIAADVPYYRPIYGTGAGGQIALTPGSFVIHGVDVRDGRPGADAPIRAIAMWWMFKRLAAVDWAQFVERFGKPWPAIKYRPGMARQEILDLIATVKAASSDMCIALPADAELELAAIAASSSSPQEAFIKVCDQQISKAIVGSTTISDAAENSESVSSPTHAGVLRERRNADAIALDETINRDLVEIWSLWNYGPGVAVPRVQSVLAEKPDPVKRLPVWQGAQTLNLTVNSKQLYEELGIERPEGVEEVLTLKPAASGFQFGELRSQMGEEAGAGDAETRGVGDAGTPGLKNA